jgi:death on curing protein
MDDPTWISRELAIAIHKRQLAEHGGADGVRDAGLLDSALGRPRHLFAYSDPTPDIPTLAAAYAFGIAKNHAFIDGNKRTAFVVCRTFLLLNGFDLTAAREDRYKTFLALAAGEVSESQLVVWLVANSKRG